MSRWPESPRPVILVGPTATGKTAAAVELAERLDGEILNADSMQVYIGMDIGTAKPHSSERARVPFHLLDVVTPDTPYSVADWKASAEAAIEAIVARGKRPIVCGGTGLYIRALLDDWSLAETPADTTLRESLRQQAEADGAPALHARLAQADPQTAERLHPNDVVRIVRALEVFLRTGQPISVFQYRDRAVRPERPAHRLGLTLPRPELYARIERRIEEMISAGLEAETRSLLARGYATSLTPLRSLGYKEMIAYLQGDTDLTRTIQDIKQNTRRFAKRQQTWFRADPQILWLDVSALSSATVAARLQEYIQASE